MSVQILSVSEFQALVNQTLEFAYQEVVVEGEISQFSVRKDRFGFFDLKDAEATVNCFVMSYLLQTPLEDGMKVRVTGTPKLTNWGKFSLTVRRLELVGEGELRRAYELLKQKLTTEDLFSQDRKRLLPVYPRRIAVVSSAASAGYQDFLKVIEQRWAGLDIRLADVQVQGEAAPAQLVAAIEYFNLEPQLPDVLVIIRGGGSLEDLAAFSTEPVVRAIAGSRIPTIVGVGHETDTSLADLAADQRAATPTDAARRVVPDKHDLQRHLERDIHQIENCFRAAVNSYQQRIQRSLQHLEQQLAAPSQRMQSLSSQLVLSMKSSLEGSRQQLSGLQRTLMGMDPERVLKRGYALVRKGEQVLRHASEATLGDLLMVKLAQGQLKAEVKDVQTES